MICFVTEEKQGQGQAKKSGRTRRDKGKEKQSLKIGGERDPGEIGKKRVQSGRGDLSRPLARLANSPKLYDQMVLKKSENEEKVEGGGGTFFSPCASRNKNRRSLKQ